MLDFTHYPSIPDHTRAALDRYVNDGCDPGGFLTAVLANDLFGAINRADFANKPALADICHFVYNNVPLKAWGDYNKVQDWVKGLSRR